jgi:hypothetical protein
LQRNRGRRNSKFTKFRSNATDGYVVSRARADMLVVHDSMARYLVSRNYAERGNIHSPGSGWDQFAKLAGDLYLMILINVSTNRQDFACNCRVAFAKSIGDIYIFI